MCHISIIVPVYNASKTIDRCIKSILNQTFKDWELICCDDNSKDNSLAILYEWGKKDSRIKVLHNDNNCGAAYTRNRCIQEAKSEYLAFIDDDDYCVPERLEKQVKFLNDNQEYSFVGTKAFVFDDYGVWKVICPIEKPQEKDFLWNSCFLNPSVMIRKRDILKVGLFRVSKETRRCEDYDLYMRLYAEGFRGYNLQEPLVYYYRGKSSYNKCKYKYRLDEAKIRFYNFKRLGLLLLGWLYILKPLVIGLVPISIIERLKRYAK